MLLQEKGITHTKSFSWMHP